MINIEYRDISLTAKADSTVSCTDKQEFCNLELLKQEGLEYKKFATLENNLWKLDATFENFPDDPKKENLALWSSSMSNENGEFQIPIEIIINFSNYESSVGLTLRFGTLTNDYIKNINVQWYQDDTLLSEKDYEVICDMAIVVRDRNELDKIITALNNLKNVKSVVRKK